MDDITRATIREWIAYHLKPLEVDLSDIKSALDKLSLAVVTTQQLDQLKYQVGSLSEAVAEVEARLRRLENYVYVMFFLLSALIIVLTTSLIVTAVKAAG